MFVDPKIVEESQLEDLGTNNIEDLDDSKVNQPISTIQTTKFLHEL